MQQPKTGLARAGFFPGYGQWSIPAEADPPCGCCSSAHTHAHPFSSDKIRQRPAGRKPYQVSRWGGGMSGRCPGKGFWNMSTPTVVRFQELNNKDRILLTYRDGSRYLEGSVQAMELIDEIEKSYLAYRNLVRPESQGAIDIDRSCTLITALQQVRDYNDNRLESALLERGEL